MAEAASGPEAFFNLQGVEGNKALALKALQENILKRLPAAAAAADALLSGGATEEKGGLEKDLTGVLHVTNGGRELLDVLTDEDFNTVTLDPSYAEARRAERAAREEGSEAHERAVAQAALMGLRIVIQRRLSQTEAPTDNEPQAA